LRSLTIRNLLKLKTPDLPIGRGGRFPGLDLFRFLAAIVVFLGHAVYFSKYSENFSQNHMLDAIRNGKFAVDFFFTLSGYVLSANLPSGKWLVGRYVRLYPVYLVGVAIGSLVLFALKGSLGISIFGTCLTIIGFQVLLANFAIAINGLLWSLSVEIILTPIFILFWKVRGAKKLNYLLIMLSVVLALVVPGSLILNAIPFFWLGAMLKNGNLQRLDFISNHSTLIVSLLALIYLSVGAKFIRSLDYSLSDFCLKLTILWVVFQCVTRLEFSARISRVWIELGKRSYALYAVHAPLVGLLLSIMKPDNLSAFCMYLFSLFTLVGIVTEVVYRIVEKPAIAWSARIRT